MSILTILSQVAAIFNAAIAAGGLFISLSGVVIKALGKKSDQIKDNVTIIIDFGTTSIEESVKRYVKAKDIDSTIFVCTNPKGFVHLDINDGDVWQEAVKGIYTFINAIVSDAPKRINIFMSAPAALAFSIGYVLRPNCTPYIYQFNQKREGIADSDLYAMVLHVNDNLKG